MKSSFHLFLLLGVFGPTSLHADANLSAKVLRVSLNQNEPALVRVGMKGVTTLEFPTRIEALDGFGFSANPLPDGPDLFQISFNKGTNFLSLKAVRPNAEGNLSVVLANKVYCLFCKEVPDPSFAVIFEDGSGRLTSGSGDAAARPKPATPARLLGLLDKLKGYPTLKVSAAEMYQNLDVAEPNASFDFEGINVLLRRVIRDDALDSVGFEVELKNQSGKDFFYDPEGFSVRVKDEVYPQSVSDAGGVVAPGQAQAAFFVVTGSATGGRNDLAVTKRFEVLLRALAAETDPVRKGSAKWEEPPNHLPVPAAPEKGETAQTGAAPSGGGTPAGHEHGRENAAPDRPGRRAGKKVAQHDP
jgi:hypothetical protein